MIVKNLIDVFKNAQFTLKEAYAANPDANPESVRARIYEHIGIEFEKVSRGIYATIDKSCLLIEGNGRNLSAIEDQSIDGIITDYPWHDPKANKGGNRNFANYETFQYTLEDFKEKFRVLKEGSFLIESMPSETATNYEELYRIKQLAKEAGFEYYAKVPWKKGTFVSNTGRTAKNSEDILFFTKGKARALKPDKQRGLDENGNPTRYMSGAAAMLPTCFDFQAVPRKEVIAQSQKPCGLYQAILNLISLPGEIILDQFAGSGAVGEACLKEGRKCILVEKSKEKVERIAERLDLVPLAPAVYAA